MKAGPGTWEYVIGDQLLVAIMDKDETQRVVTFPEGDWVDYFDNTKVHHGPSEVEISVPMNRYPVFIRSGSTIPLDVVNGYAGHGDKSSAGAVTLDIYPDPARPAAFPLWDEKLGKTDITCAAKAGVTSVTLDGGPAREYVLRIMTPKSPKQLRLVATGNVTPLEELDRRRWDAKSIGWRYDAADQRLWVRVRAEGKTTVEVE